ncbi:amidohydrolase family protein [Mucilaginibacter ginsenosidivorans]|uniref:Amidohydrolase family protein n=2 Tax=Mucilaginibacter ginsenosidivorans TaxID=398053 RepID=A0A5B8UW36_9SPHI|nr:amidohydrolase family protein [Mucilaginibacter ginsenosidivorans]QEC63284.1 amidohydrolase family protein [Mucilaginibacter ginsenosidivorans]
MILNNLKMAITGAPVNIRVAGGCIANVWASPPDHVPGEFNLEFKNAIVFPGLINSHDHLDFNLFPALGDRTYKNYTEWGRYIHKNYPDKIGRIMRVPTVLREQWGVYKNLLNGITTVVNHGKKVKKNEGPITVFENCQCIHSVRFEKKWWLQLNNPLKKNVPVAIHTGEGIDEASAREIDKLISRNMLKRDIIGIHGVAMNEDQAQWLKALVWCPESNYFLLGKTAPVGRLKENVPIVFGTDSTLTGDWNLWEHIRRARATKQLTDIELFETLTINPANTWKLKTGEIAEGKDADIVVAKEKKSAPASDAFFGLNPEDILMVVHKGHIVLFDEDIYPQLKSIDLDNYGRVYIKAACKYVSGNLPQLMHRISEFYRGVNFPVI